MPITPTTFFNSKSLHGANYRAFAEVRVLDSSGIVKATVRNCLVDTGSDFTILPMWAAHSAGIVPSSQQVIKTAGGTSFTLSSAQNVDLIVEGYALPATVLFSPAAGFQPILGRIELINAFDAGFDINNWYWG